MPFDAIKRRDFVALLGGMAAWPLTAQAQQPATASADLDPRITPLRDGVAAKRLEGRVSAVRFETGKVYEIAAAQAPLREARSSQAALATEALKGERITIYDIDQDGWAWGELADDGYVGYLPAGLLSESGPPATHKVSVPRTLVFPGPSIKLQPIEALSFGSRLAISRTDDTFAVTADGGHVPALHVAPVAAAERDFVAVAERFLRVPYLWGGKTSLGIDCSGLVQLALSACGVRCPRDTDMQERALGQVLAPSLGTDQLERGDLLFWKGHVAIARDRTSVLHANAYHMAVATEPASIAMARIGASSGDITSIRRLTPVP